MPSTKKKPAQRRKARRAVTAVPPAVQVLTLERRVVDLLELLHALNASTALTAQAARKDSRGAAEQLVRVLEWLQQRTSQAGQTAVGLEHFLAAVNPSAALDDEPDAKDCEHCGAPCWRKSYDADESCGACHHTLRTKKPCTGECCQEEPEVPHA